MRLTIGPYKILRKLGEGGMGVVYEGVHEAISRRVAIKVLRANHAVNLGAVERFFNEARAVNLIEHPSLVQVSDFGRESDGSAYLVMEFLRGESLAARLQRVNLATQTVVQIAWQIADALVAVHEQEIVHRDLKPDNIMLVPEPVALGGERVKILDFGIAKLVHMGQNKTNSDMLMGTPAYMSPEQCKGAGQVDTKSDVYSLGVILFAMLAGRTPFLGEFGELIGHHLYNRPPSILSLVPHCPLNLAHLVELLLNKEKSLRPTMKVVRTELSQALCLFGNEGSYFQALPGLPSATIVNHPAEQRSTLGRAVGQSTANQPRTWHLTAAMASGVLILAIGLRLSLSSFERAGSNRRETAITVSADSDPSAAPGVLPDLLRTPPAPPYRRSLLLVEPVPQKNSVHLPNNRAAEAHGKPPMNKRIGKPQRKARLPATQQTQLPLNQPPPVAESFTDVD